MGAVLLLFLMAAYIKAMPENKRENLVKDNSDIFK